MCLFSCFRWLAAVAFTLEAVLVSLRYSKERKGTYKGILLREAAFFFSGRTTKLGGGGDHLEENNFFLQETSKKGVLGGHR